MGIYGVVVYLGTELGIGWLLVGRRHIFCRSVDAKLIRGLPPFFSSSSSFFSLFRFVLRIFLSKDMAWSDIHIYVIGDSQVMDLPCHGGSLVLVPISITPV